MLWWVPLPELHGFVWGMRQMVLRQVPKRLRLWAAQTMWWETLSVYDGCLVRMGTFTKPTCASNILPSFSPLTSFLAVSCSAEEEIFCQEARRKVCLCLGCCAFFHCTCFALIAVANLAVLRWVWACLCGSVLSPTFSKPRMVKMVLKRSRRSQRIIPGSSTWSPTSFQGRLLLFLCLSPTGKNEARRQGTTKSGSERRLNLNVRNAISPFRHFANAISMPTISSLIFSHLACLNYQAFHCLASGISNYQVFIVSPLAYSTGNTPEPTAVFISAVLS